MSEEEKKPISAEWGALPLAIGANLPIALVRDGATYAAGQYSIKQPEKPATQDLYSKLQKAMGGEHVPYHGSSQASTGGAWVPPWSVDMMKNFPVIREATSNQMGFDISDALKKGHPKGGVILGASLDGGAAPPKPDPVLSDSVDDIFKRIYANIERIREGRKETFTKKMDPAILAHELGHATGVAPLRSRFAGIASGMGMTIGPTAGMAYSAYKSDPEESIGTTLGKGALRGTGVSLAFGAPRLAEELRASVRGYRGLKNVGYAGSPTKLLAAAFSTYLMQSALKGTTGGILGSALGRIVKRIKIRNNQEQEQANQVNG